MARSGFAMMIMFIAGMTALTPVVAESQGGTMIDQGRSIAFDRKKGNCLACHAMAEGESPGNIGPPLVAMQERYPDRAVLRAQIWDAGQKNPDTAMPPFGRHQILSESEIDAVVAFVSSL